MDSNLRFGQLEELMADFIADMGKLNSRIVKIESRLSSLEDKFDRLLDMFLQFTSISDERYEENQRYFGEFQSRFNKIEELYVDTLDKKSFEHFVDAILDRMDEIKTVQTKTDILDKKVDKLEVEIQVVQNKTDILDKKVDKLEVDNIEIKSKLDLILAKLSA